MIREDFLNGIKAIYGEGNVEERSITKDNKIIEGIAIRVGGPVAPTIYYNTFDDIEDTDEAVHEAVKMIESARLSEGQTKSIVEFAESLTGDWNVAKRYVFPVIVNAESEMTEDLFTVPLKDLGLKMYFRFVLPEDTLPISGAGSIKMSKAMFECLNIPQGVEELVSVAKANASGVAMYKGISSVLCGLMGVNAEMLAEMGIPTNLPIEEDQLIVVSNESKMYGAVSMLLPEIMENIANQIGREEFLIAPSSIHEILVANGDVVPEELKAIVMEINANEVSPADFLSDDIFRYKKGVGVTRVVA